ncbi:MAG: PEP-CTERM sorting domain-containing protein [Acaryochloris sp. RU_4_1]|nr:PEP-CTERM sorting domain-containing protein [Acaryochloris sp. RU_4_1]NJR56155.1 PEP-CTERM sorting domain-containing protein [Acaryochloris sp. CRU_2_0]
MQSKKNNQKSKIVNVAFVAIVVANLKIDTANAASLSIGSYVRSEQADSGFEFAEKQIAIGSDGSFVGNEFGFTFGGTLQTQDPISSIFAQIRLENFFVKNVSAARIGAVSPQISIFEMRFSDSLFVENKDSKGSVLAKGSFLGPGSLEEGDGASFNFEGSYISYSRTQEPQLFSTGVSAYTNPGFPMPLPGNKNEKRFSRQSEILIPAELVNPSTLSPSARTLFAQGSLEFISRPGEILTFKEASISSGTERVPEPSSILGLIIALSGGIYFRKKSPNLLKQKAKVEV